LKDKVKRLNWKEDAKRRVAIESVKLIKDGQVVGLGTGSTAKYMIDELGRRICEEGLKISGIPTSLWTSERAKKNKIPLTTLDEHPQLDIAIDGADQVDLELNLIKGLGGALTREKIIDTAAENLVIIIDESKLVEKLGVNQVVPIEVIPMACAPVIEKLRKLGGKPNLRTRKDNGDFFITDNGNYIIDVAFGAINNGKILERKINMIPGIVENGLFIGVTQIVFVGYQDRVARFEKK
jgi:ribose 5-phosphate isomerase A